MTDQRGQERGHHVQRRCGHHLLQERHDRRPDSGGAEADPTGRGPRHLTAVTAAPFQQRRGMAQADGKTGQRDAQNPRRSRRQAEGHRGQAAGAGRQEADPDDPVAEQFRVRVGQRKDRHPAHRVPDKDHRSRRHHLGQHSIQIVTELLDRACRDIGGAG